MIIQQCRLAHRLRDQANHRLAYVLTPQTREKVIRSRPLFSSLSLFFFSFFSLGKETPPRQQKLSKNISVDCFLIQSFFLSFLSLIPFKVPYSFPPPRL